MAAHHKNLNIYLLSIHLFLGQSRTKCNLQKKKWKLQPDSLLPCFVHHIIYIRVYTYIQLYIYYIYTSPFSNHPSESANVVAVVVFTLGVIPISHFGFIFRWERYINHSSFNQHYHYCPKQIHHYCRHPWDILVFSQPKPQHRQCYQD